MNVWFIHLYATRIDQSARSTCCFAGAYQRSNGNMTPKCMSHIPADTDFPPRFGTKLELDADYLPIARALETSAFPFSHVNLRYGSSPTVFPTVSRRPMLQAADTSQLLRVPDPEIFRPEVKGYRMAKSAINLLQELTIKQGSMPKYDFSEKRVDKTIMQFTCYVSVKQLKTHGTGSSKKEAKHNAAENMLSLLNTNNKIPPPTDISLSFVTNVMRSPANVYEMSSLSNQSTTVNKSTVNGQHIERNYVGLLQEYCQQRKIPITDIHYKVVYDEGQPHMKTFTMEVSIGSLELHERATGKCKKIIKQEVARKLLLHLNPAIVNTKVANTNILSDINKNHMCDKKMLENNIKELGTEIIDNNKEILSLEKKLSENAKLHYLEFKSSDKSYKVSQEVGHSEIKNLHTLFKKNYSNKIPYGVREKIQIIRNTQNKYTDLTDLWQIRRDIESLLKVKIQKIKVRSTTKNHITCLRMLSNPCITQIGMGETSFMAEFHAMYNFIIAISIFLNI